MACDRQHFRRCAKLRRDDVRLPKRFADGLDRAPSELVSVAGKQADGVPMLSGAGTGADARIGSCKRRCGVSTTLGRRQSVSICHQYGPAQKLVLHRAAEQGWAQLPCRLWFLGQVRAGLRQFEQVACWQGAGGKVRRCNEKQLKQFGGHAA